MDLTSILIAALVLGGLGLIFGALLAVTSKVFAVPSNPKADALRECLPGANCGACGFPGCDGYAAAVADGKAEVGKCPVGGAPVAAKMGEIMGVSVEAGARKVASLNCQGSVGHCKPKYEYNGIEDCLAASLVADGNKSCPYACLGLGTCERACPFDAIHVDPVRKIAVVDEEKCQGCEKCVAVCPKHVLSMKPADRKVSVVCNSHDKAKDVKERCKVGCIGCTKCEKVCKFGAIMMENNLPVIDYTKCVGCMMCAESCPTGALWGDLENRFIAKIDPDACVGCTLCKKQCEFDAILGELKQKHKVLDACTGCGKCAAKCPKKAITMCERHTPRDPMATAAKLAPKKAE